MPCRDDGPPRDSCEVGSLAYVELRQRLDEVTALLCGVMQVIEAAIYSRQSLAAADVVAQLNFSLAPEVHAWWQRYKQEDAARQAREAAEAEAERKAEAERLRKEFEDFRDAISMLSPATRAMLRKWLTEELP